MANLLMPLQIERQYSGSLDANYSFDTLEELKTYATTSALAYPGQILYCVEEDALYKVNSDKTNATGLASGASVENLYNSIQANNKLIGDLSLLKFGTYDDVVSALNKLDTTFIKNITFANKVITLIYDNGLTTNVDISSMIANTSISDLKDVDVSSATEGQSLCYDSTTGKFIPRTVNNEGVLELAKEYTDNEIDKIALMDAIICDEKPTYADGTITYIQNGTTYTTTNELTWFLYDENAQTQQTIFKGGIEKTISSNEVNLSDVVKKSEILTSYDGVTVLPPNTIIGAGGLRQVQVKVAEELGKKVNVTDIVDDLNTSDTTVPLSANQGRVLRQLIEDKIDATSGETVMLRKTFLNATKDSSYEYESPIPLNYSAVVNVYSVASGSSNLTDSLIEFTNKNNFINDVKKVVIDDNGAGIIDSYETTFILNGEGLYESELISKSDFVQLVMIKEK